MPFLKCHLYKEPRSRVLERLGYREGWRATIKNPSQSRYTGEWKNSVKDGYGRCITRSDQLYDGLWTNQLRNGPEGILCHGIGKNTYEMEYRGMWKNGHFDGKGQRHYEDGSFFKGIFKRSKRNGYGQMWYQNGSFYDGNWIEDKRNGLALFVEWNGNRYEGNWVDDLKHGQGRYYHLASGQYQDGVWKNDNCITSIMADIPFRQTSTSPTKYTINEIQLEDEANLCTDIIETTMLYLDSDKWNEGGRFDLLSDVKSSYYSTTFKV